MTKPDIIPCTIAGDFILSEDSDLARELFHQSCFGSLQHKRVALSFFEAMYLFEIEKISILDSRNKKLSHAVLLRRAQQKDKQFWTKYCVFRDLRSRGYVVKTALKFGADFRVYDRGVKPGEDHAKWVVYPVYESESMTWHEFSSKNRVAHSTKKRLLLAVVDEEGDVSYWETRWLRP